MKQKNECLFLFCFDGNLVQNKLINTTSMLRPCFTFILTLLQISLDTYAST